MISWNNDIDVKCSLPATYVVEMTMVMVAMSGVAALKNSPPRLGIRLAELYMCAKVVLVTWAQFFAAILQGEQCA